MYDIKSLNIWRESSNSDIFKCKKKVLEIEASRRKEISMTDKCQKVFEEIVTLVPTADFTKIKERRGGKLRYPIYINEKIRTTEIDALELSVRSSNCLHRAGYKTIGELVEAIESREDLKKIRNCGAKSIDEIMEQLFCYQYRQLDRAQRIKYIEKILRLNGGE